MITPEKVEAWIKEVSERPTSAPILVEYIANRLHDLSKQNDELRAENIALQSGKRVEEYEQRIQHLEYQLELLKKQLGGVLPIPEQTQAAPAQASKRSALLYSQAGHILRIPFDLPAVPGKTPEIHTVGSGFVNAESPRLLVVQESEDLLFVFSSGRVATQAVDALPSGALDWSSSALPNPPRAGESLVCVEPLGKLPLAEAFLQISRRGFVKKIRAAMAQSIFANHYIGSGVTQPADRSFSILFNSKEDRLVLVSHEGFLLCLDTRLISASVEEAIRLNASDHLVAGFIVGSAENLVIMTNRGKLIHWTPDRLETSALKTRGQALFSAQRREQGVRVVSAAMVQAGDWCAAYDADGKIIFHPIDQLLSAGALDSSTDLLAFVTFAPSVIEKK